MRRSILLGTLVCLTACTAPQGKKIARNTEGLPPVATGPAISNPNITLQNAGEIVALSPAKTLTVTLPSYNRDGYAWRLSEIPDPSVLRLVSQDFTRGADLTKPGEQTMVFEGTGVGDVPVKMWYGTLWASPMEATHPFEFVASVNPEPKKSQAKAEKKTTKGTAKKPRRKPEQSEPAKTSPTDGAPTQSAPPATAPSAPSPSPTPESAPAPSAPTPTAPTPSA